MAEDTRTYRAPLQPPSAQNRAAQKTVGFLVIIAGVVIAFIAALGSGADFAGGNHELLDGMNGLQWMGVCTLGIFIFGGGCAIVTRD